MFIRTTRSQAHFGWGTISLAAALAASSVSAAPLVLEETARITAPDPEYVWPVSLAIDGDWLLASGVRLNSDLTDSSTWLYQRQSNGSWQLVRRLHQTLVEEDGDEPLVHVAMQGGVAVILKENASWIFERSGSTWNPVPSPIQTDGMDAEVNGGTVLVTSGHCGWSSNAYRKGTNGAWTLVRQTPPDPDPDYICENEDTFGDVDVASDGATMVVASLAFGGAALLYEGPFGTPPLRTRLTAAIPGDPFGYKVAIENTSLIASSLLRPESYTREAVGQWVRSGPLQRPDQLALGAPYEFEMSGGLAILSQLEDGLHGARTGSMSVFERNSDGTYRYAARLLASDREGGQIFGIAPEISGRRLAVRNYSTQSLHVFELPADLYQRPTLQDNFEDGNAGDWTPSAGSNFVVATTSTSRVYRQSSVAGNAASVWNHPFENQAVEADIKPTAFATTAGDKWFGLFARHTDANNYYYVTLRNNNSVLLRRMLNGVFTTLDSASLPITLNRSYRVRLEAIGTRLRVFVDGQLMAEARDTTLDQGQPGIMMYKASADYDNVLVSANPRTALVSHSFDSSDSPYVSWHTLGSWSRDDFMFTQTDVSGGARAITGVATDDQVVQARMRRTGGFGSNNWLGLAARYQDESNYYYVTLRNNNTIALRKLVNGAIIELDTAPFTTANNAWYAVRLEAVGSHLRVYINDVLRLDAIDSSHATGRYGPVMYRTSAQYDDIVALEP